MNIEDIRLELDELLRLDVISKAKHRQALAVIDQLGDRCIPEGPVSVSDAVDYILDFT